MKSILVTGGAGFIGSNFIRYLMNQGSNLKIINFDKLTYSGNPSNLKDVEKSTNYKFIKGDICDVKAVSAAMRNCDYVINFAAETHVDRSIKSSSEFIKTNIDGVRVLLDCARKHKIKRLIQISTDEVYGDIKRGLSKEEDNLLPNSPYAASKAAADLLCRSYFTTYKFPVIITRSSNNFGPYQYPEKVMPLFITNAIKDNHLPLYGDGKNVRDWIHVIDNCAGIGVVLKKGKPGQIYNIGGGNCLANIKIAKDILKLLNKNRSLIKYVKDRPGHDRRYALSSKKLNNLGWNCEYDFKKALRLTIEWYLDNEWWWKPIKKKAKIIKW